MSNKLYKATFKGIRKTAKSPLYSTKNACLRWVANNSQRVLGELLVYELDLEKTKQSNDRVASAYEYPELRLDAEQTISVENLLNAEKFAFDLGRTTLFGILNLKEELKLGIAQYDKSNND